MRVGGGGGGVGGWVGGGAKVHGGGEEGRLGRSQQIRMDTESFGTARADSRSIPDRHRLDLVDPGSISDQWYGSTTPIDPESITDRRSTPGRPGSIHDRPRVDQDRHRVGPNRYRIDPDRFRADPTLTTIWGSTFVDHGSVAVQPRDYSEAIPGRWPSARSIADRSQIAGRSLVDPGSISGGHRGDRARHGSIPDGSEIDDRMPGHRLEDKGSVRLDAGSTTNRLPDDTGSIHRPGSISDRSLLRIDPRSIPDRPLMIDA